MTGLLALALVVSACQYTPQIKEPTFTPVDSAIYAGDGQLLTTLHSAGNRQPVPLDRIAPVLQTAVVAIEDARYFDHSGVDPRALVRAITRDAQAGGTVEGASTITQQYVRNVILDDRDKTISRKAREAVLAVELERRYTKRQILERYLNTVYFGDGAYGVEAAAKHYFAKDAVDLDLAESALLAGIIRSPEGYNPYLHPDDALARRNVVLDRMRSLDRAGLDAVDVARAGPLGVAAKTDATADGRYPAGHFVERVKQFILTDPHFGLTPEARRRELYQGGLKIETTIDLKLQADAEAAIGKVLTRTGRDPSGALVSVDPANGHVLAYVGGPRLLRLLTQRRVRSGWSGRTPAGFLVQAVRARGRVAKRHPPHADLQRPRLDRHQAARRDRLAGEELRRRRRRSREPGRGHGRLGQHGLRAADHGRRTTEGRGPRDADGGAHSPARVPVGPRSEPTASRCSTWRRPTRRSRPTGSTPTRSS